MSRDVDPAHLHPAFRDRLASVLGTLESEGIPFRVFEGWRSAPRQQYLWEQGRTRPGSVVTRARAWQSYHQYGLGADLVLFENGQWSWDASGHRAAWWSRLHEAGRLAGLEPLSFEQPHLQLQGCSVTALASGEYPAGGDESWRENLAASIYGWTGEPTAPPLPQDTVERPPLPVEPRASDHAPLPAPFVAGWHSRRDGQEWRCDAGGIYTRRSHPDPVRTPGPPVTMRRVWELFGDIAVGASRAFSVHPALIMMVIATETAAHRRFGFTGPTTFRWEPGVKVADVVPEFFGDYSAGPMQILATTARDVVRARRLAYEPFTVAPVFSTRPEPPANLPLYDAGTSVEIGTAIIAQAWARTGGDPILVAAAYNAGGLYASGANAWRLRTTGDHLDRASEWYGDACRVLADVGVTR